jgi:superfamily II DNA/RNA helicase
VSQQILIFVDTKVFADSLGGLLCQEPFNIVSTALHGDRSQEDRDRAFEDFKRGRHTVLVATSVAARGIDVKDVGAVINYDMPKDHTEYIHRIGRTARIGHDGESVTLLDPKRDSGSISNLIAILKDADKPIPDVLANWSSGGGYSSYRGGGGNSFGQSASDHREYNNQVREAGQGYAPTDVMPESKEWKPKENPEEEEW